MTQIIVAYLIELFGCFGVEKASFEWQKVIGALIAIGEIVCSTAELLWEIQPSLPVQHTQNKIHRTINSISSTI